MATDRGTAIVDATTNTFSRLVDERPSWGIAAAAGTARQVFLAERNGNLTRLTP